MAKKIKGTDLSFITTVKCVNRDLTAKRKYRKLIGCLKKGWSNDRTGKFMGISSLTVSKMRGEIKVAFSQGYKTLEAYFAAGRPCRAHMRIIA